MSRIHPTAALIAYRRCTRLLCPNFRPTTSFRRLNSNSKDKPSISFPRRYESTPSTSKGNESTITTEITKASVELQIKIENGLPILEVPLPSRDEFCRFVLRPISDTVGTFCDYLREEDKGVEISAVYACDGTRISRSVSIEHLMLIPHFRLRINDQFFEVSTPQSNAIEARELLKSTDRLKDLNDLRAKIATLHTIFNVDDFKLERERKLLERLEEVEKQLLPMEKVRKEIEKECERYSTNVLWCGFIAMGLQTGIFARLTWFEYSWDIVEPCTYFATYSTVFATFGYYIYTKQNFEYPSAEGRIFSHQFYKRAKKQEFSIETYNELKRLQTELRSDLQRIRDPLCQHLPASRLLSLEGETAKFRLRSSKSSTV
ncbi:Calcium uniporter protein [Aphelenchoides besseyi]|nr:Calcium uniporter protein [Aphelenchoides besseyi]KAI6193103.1 Calcium uniporter protein [Aphelenchoides besseyi]